MKADDLLKYKGYYGSIHFDIEHKCFYGKVEFIRDLITYEAHYADSLVNNFQSALDDYLEDCKAQSKAPDTPFKGTFNVRIEPETHKKLSLYAIQHNDTLNNVVKKALGAFSDSLSHQ